MRRSIRPVAVTAALLLALSVPATALGQAGAAARPAPEPGAAVAVGRTAHVGAKLARLAIARATLAAHRAAAPAGLTDPAPAGPSVAPAASTTPTFEARPAVSITLGCAVVRPDGAATDSLLGPEYRVAVACRWSKVDDARIRAYRLWRIKDGGTRSLIATVPAGQPPRYLDTRVSFGHRYTYAVVAVKANGSAAAVSRPVTVRIPPGAETIRLGCALGAIDDERGVIPTPVPASQQPSASPDASATAVPVRPSSSAATPRPSLTPKPSTITAIRSIKLSARAVGPAQVGVLWSGTDGARRYVLLASAAFEGSADDPVYGRSRVIGEFTRPPASPLTLRVGERVVELRLLVVALDGDGTVIARSNVATVTWSD